MDQSAMSVVSPGRLDLLRRLADDLAQVWSLNFKSLYRAAHRGKGRPRGSEAAAQEVLALVVAALHRNETWIDRERFRFPALDPDGCGNAGVPTAELAALFDVPQRTVLRLIERGRWLALEEMPVATGEVDPELQEKIDALPPALEVVIEERPWALRSRPDIYTSSSPRRQRQSSVDVNELKGDAYGFQFSWE